MGKKVSIVILNWNGRELLERFLPSVVRNSPSDIADVVVADNGSSDGSLDMMRKEFPSVRLICFDKNYGFAEGYNRALGNIGTPYSVLLNSDVEVTEGWLDAPLGVLDSDQRIAAVQPKIRSWRNPSFFEYAGAAGGYMDKYGYPYCRGRVFDVVEEDRGQYDNPAELLWASGACLFVRTGIYKDAGGLDSGFFAHQEEIDFCWRLRSRGYRVVCIPSSVVYHVGGATLGMEHPRKTFLNFRNNLLMLYKNLPPESLKHVMRIRFFLDYLAALRFILGGHPGNAMAVYKARRAFRSLRPGYEPKRKENMDKRLTDLPSGLTGICLLWKFYVKRVKVFSSLHKNGAKP